MATMTAPSVPGLDAPLPTMADLPEPSGPSPYRRRASDPPPPGPPAPGSLAETGLTPDLLAQLLLKWLYNGEASGIELSEGLRLPYSTFEALVEHARAERLVEVRGASGAGSAGYRFALTDLGRDRARHFLDVSQYVGPAPVPLSQYVSAVKTAAAHRDPVGPARVASKFSHLVLGASTLEQLGPAINSGKSVFLYGPPGNGKTVIAEGVAETLGGDVFVPHALEVGGQIITVFDPVSHTMTEADREPSLAVKPTHDRRWVRVRRPAVIVGGELTLDMLDLSFNPISKFYDAPLQLKSNGGVFVVDDLGRQRVSPRDLLNRWIVPLESRRDYLSLHTGRKFEIPFDVLIIFATNLRPESLADEAFLRRIPYKVAISNPTVDEFQRLFEMYCHRREIQMDPAAVDHLQREYYQARQIPMRGCHPRDLIEQIVDLSRYRGATPAVTVELLDVVCRSYFLEEAPQWETSPVEPQAA